MKNKPKAFPSTVLSKPHLFSVFIIYTHITHTSAPLFKPHMFVRTSNSVVCVCESECVVRRGLQVCNGACNIFDIQRWTGFLSLQNCYCWFNGADTSMHAFMHTNRHLCFSISLKCVRLQLNTPIPEPQLLVNITNLTEILSFLVD